MAIQDSSTQDAAALSVEHVDQARKGQAKTARQIKLIVDAVGQLKLAEESPTYFISAKQWEEILALLRGEVDGLEAHVQRLAERRSRGRHTHFEWRDGKLVKL
jgi:hypothetical protein